jgi:hypothetical protein
MPNDAGSRGAIGLQRIGFTRIGFTRIWFMRSSDIEIGDLLGKEVYFAGILAGQTFKDFDKGAFGAVTAINERRNYG